MNLARVVGTVICTEKVPSWRGQRLLLIQPVGVDGAPLKTRPLAAVDCVSAGPGQLVFFVRGREAATALENPENPADAAITGLVDALRHEPEARR